MEDATSTATKPKAYSYLRFSTPEQMRGDSSRRQAQLAEEWAVRHGVELDGRSYQDLGISAYRGANAETGMLREFLDAVESGAIEPGSFLLIESLDRLSRNKPRRAIRLLESICESGIKLVTLTDGKVYTEETLDDDPMAFMWAFMVAIRANEESELKARRLKAAWETKRSKVGEKPLTARVPAWLKLDRSTNKFLVLEDRAAVVRRIFQMALEGVGLETIATTFNREGIPTFGSASMWRRSYILKILNSPTVVGTIVPHVVEYVEGKRVRRPLDPVEGYYPAVVAKEVFEQVQAQRAGLKAPATRKGQLRNILGGLASCPTCDSSMTRVTKGSSKKAGRPYLVCSRAKVGAGCSYRSVPLDLVEDAIKDHASWLLATMPSGDETLDRQILALETRIEASQAALSILLEELTEGRSPAISQKIREIEVELEDLEKEHSALIQKHQLSSPIHLARAAAQALSLLEDDPLDLVKANAALRRLFSKVVVDYINGELQFEWQHGGSSSITFAWPGEDAA